MVDIRSLGEAADDLLVAVHGDDIGAGASGERAVLASVATEVPDEFGATFLEHGFNEVVFRGGGFVVVVAVGLVVGPVGLRAGTGEAGDGALQLINELVEGLLGHLFVGDALECSRVAAEAVAHPSLGGDVDEDVLAEPTAEGEATFQVGWCDAIDGAAESVMVGLAGEGVEEKGVEEHAAELGVASPGMAGGVWFEGGDIDHGGSGTTELGVEGGGVFQDEAALDGEAQRREVLQGSCLEQFERPFVHVGDEGDGFMFEDEGDGGIEAKLGGVAAGEFVGGDNGAGVGQILE